MAYTNSSLVVYTKRSPMHSGLRTQPIRKITIHHMAGNLSVETCGSVFQSRLASANYGIGSDGRIALYVDEKNRSWASSSSWNDNQAVTIEVANNKIGGNWSVSSKAMKSLIDLCVDICKRNGIPKLEYTGDTNGTLTIHSMYAPTACPGPYLKSKLKYITTKVNKQLAKKTTITATSGKINTVAKVQSWLNSTFNNKLDVDGIYGAKTKKALVKALQKTLGVAVDGVFGTITKGAVKTLKKGSKGTLVKILQAFLVCEGYGKYTWVTGKFGTGTRTALKNYQKAKSLTADGVAGKATFSKLCK